MSSEYKGRPGDSRIGMSTVAICLICGYHTKPIADALDFQTKDHEWELLIKHLKEHE